MYAIIHDIAPFDVSNGTTIKFTWNGNQIYKVRCIVKNNESGNVVYDQTIDTMKPIYTIQPNSTLTNGGYYIVYLTTFDVNNKESDLQEIGTPFYCFETPEFVLSIEEDTVIRSSSFLSSLTYQQADNELLDFYNISLYSYQHIPVQSSGNVYDTSSLSYLISGLENGKQYYLRATGSTVHGMQLDTGYIPFMVAYVQKQIFSTIEANNLADIGAIELRSNIVSAEGVSVKPVVYIDGKYADLRDNAVTFDIGYEAKGDNSHVFALNNPILNSSVVHITDSSGLMQIDCYYREGSYEDSNGQKAQIELSASMGSIYYVVYSNYVPIPSDNQNLLFCVNRVGGYFSVQAIVLAKS